MIALPLSKKRALEKERGYGDLDPENIWIEWLAFRVEMAGREPPPP